MNCASASDITETVEWALKTNQPTYLASYLPTAQKMTTIPKIIVVLMRDCLCLIQKGVLIAELAFYQTRGWEAAVTCV